jgi:glyoxylase-like metal-dependent hydrolase (beta-lactamase superfamily II)
MAEVKVLVEGKHEEIDDKHLKIGATSTLIKSDKNILVDPGYFADADLLLKNLKETGLSPENIDFIFLTHLHLDHIANSYLFPDAKLICKLRKNYPGQMHTLNKGYLERFDLNDGVEIAKDVSVLTTPGHSGDMLSLIVNAPSGRIVIAGDAFPSQDFIDLNKLPGENLVDDMEEFIASRKKILKLANWIIPGHGAMFKNETL